MLHTCCNNCCFSRFLCSCNFLSNDSRLSHPHFTKYSCKKGKKKNLLLFVSSFLRQLLYVLLMMNQIQLVSFDFLISFEPSPYHFLFDYHLKFVERKKKIDQKKVNIIFEKYFKPVRKL